MTETAEHRGLAFPMTVYVVLGCLVVAVGVIRMPEVPDESFAATLRDIAILVALVVVGAVVSAGFVGFLSRAQGFNAQKMLDQLDAQRAQ